MLQRRNRMRWFLSLPCRLSSRTGSPDLTIKRENGQYRYKHVQPGRSRQGTPEIPMKGCFTCLNLICFPGACDQQQVDENYSTCLYELQDILGECTFDCYKGNSETKSEYRRAICDHFESNVAWELKVNSRKFRGYSRLCRGMFRNLLRRPWKLSMHGQLSWWLSLSRWCLDMSWSQWPWWSCCSCSSTCWRK